MSNAATVERNDVDLHGRPGPCFHDYLNHAPGRRADERPAREGRPDRAKAEMRIPTPLPAWRLMRVVRYVDARLDQKIRMTDLAREVRLSRMHFAAQFNAATGLRPLEYVMRRRIRKAQELLVSSEKSIVQIALAVGFQTQAHFTTVFRRCVGETPCRWRRAMTDGPSDSDLPADIQRAIAPALFAGKESSALDPSCRTAAVDHLGSRRSSPSIRVWPRGQHSSEACSGIPHFSGDDAREAGAGQCGGFGYGDEGVAEQDDPRGLQRLALLEQAVAGAVHDINHIVARMIATMELIALRVRSGVPVGLDSLVEEGRFAGERVSRLTDRVMDYTRPVGSAPCPVDVNRIITRTRPLLSRALGNVAICRLNLRQDLRPAWCDATELERTLLNLVVNARDALCGQEGTVTLETCITALADPQGGLPPGDYVCITVSNDGGGMTDSVLKRACEPFVTTKPRGREAGLGLALVRRFIDQSDGHIDIDSTAGIGTVIRMYLPAQAPFSCAADPVSSKQPELESRTPRQFS